MISRVAEDCFWLSRYMERVETVARLLDVNLGFHLDVSLPEGESWRPLVVVIGEQETWAKRVDPSQADDAEKVQEFLTWDRDSPASIYSALAGARENARTIRETISLEMWEAINELWLWMDSKEAHRLYAKNRHGFYEHLRDESVRYHGFSHLTMLHDDPFSFLRLGASLERANQTARILDVKYHALGPSERSVEMPWEAAQWLAILRSCSSIEAFFKRAANVLSGPAVAEFLLFEPHHPRSVRYNVDRAANFVRRLRAASGDFGAHSQREIERFVDALDRLTIEEVLDRSIHDVLTWVVNETAVICEAIREDYFSPVPGETASTQVQVMSSEPA